MADTYSNRSNARRAAEAMLAKGTAPAAKYGLTALSTADGGGIRIEWQIEEAAPAEPTEPKPVKTPRQPRKAPANPLAKAAAAADATAAKGVMPTKPVTSKANPSYQKKFDHLAERAASGDWPAVRAYEVKGVNTYAKMVIRYRDRLLAAHEARS
jgi:hypothetical protein